jgi:hypothetical protein
VIHRARPWPSSSPDQAWQCPRWPSRQWPPTCAGPHGPGLGQMHPALEMPGTAPARSGPLKNK